MSKPSDRKEGITIRFPRKLREQVDKLAKLEGRSINNFVVRRMEILCKEGAR